MQLPVILAVERLFSRYGIPFLHLLSGRGHHFIWHVQKNSQAFNMLADIGRVPEPLAACYRQPCAATGEAVKPALAAAWSGKATSSTGSREAISIDISEYGDPLHTRGMRVPFSGYLKPMQQ